MSHPVYYGIDPNGCDEYCSLCGQPIDSCICPACPLCEAQGDPQCYLPYPYGHSLKYNYLQFRHHELTRKHIATEQEKENRYWDDEFILQSFNHHSYACNCFQYVQYSNEVHRECLLSIANAIHSWEN